MFIRSVLASPLAGVGLALAEMGDTILVGHAIGMGGLAVIGFASPLFLLATFFVFGLSMGGAIVYSNLMHEGKKEEAMGIFHFFFRVSLLIGFGIMAAGFLWQDELLIFLGVDPKDEIIYEMTKSYVFYILLGIPFEIMMEVLASYLRNDDADAISVGIQTASGIGNLVISALLLFVFDWGIAGCSFGFFFANAAATVFALVFILLRSRGELTFRGRMVSFQKALKPLRLGFATSSEYIFDAVFTLVAIHLIMEVDGPEGVGIFNIIENLSLLFIFLYELIGKTSQPLFSTFFAECNFRELHRVFRYAVLYSLLWGVLFMLVVMLWPQILDLLFGMEDIEDVSQAYYAARVFCIGSIFMGIALILQNYLQSEEDEGSAFFVVFMRRMGAGLPLLLLLGEFGFYVFWWVYPLTEIITLCALYVYKKHKGEQKIVPEDRVYAASFLGNAGDIAKQLDQMEEFAVYHHADPKKLNTLRLVVEEICGLMGERAGREDGEPLLTQLTLIAEEDGSFKLHLRDDGKEWDPLKITQERLSQFPEKIEKVDIRGLGILAVKTRVQQFLYRNYHGFNTMTVVI